MFRLCLNCKSESVFSHLLHFPHSFLFFFDDSFRLLDFVSALVKECTDCIRWFNTSLTGNESSVLYRCDTSWTSPECWLLNRVAYSFSAWNIVHAVGFMCNYVLAPVSYWPLWVEEFGQFLVRLCQMESFCLAVTPVEDIIWRFIEVARIISYARTLLAESRCIVRCPSHYRVILSHCERILICTFRLTLGHWHALALASWFISTCLHRHRISPLHFRLNVRQVINERREIHSLLVF